MSFIKNNYGPITVEKQLNVTLCQGGDGTWTAQSQEPGKGAESNEPRTSNEQTAQEEEPMDVQAENPMNEVSAEELCHFIYPGMDDAEAQRIHRQIHDLVRRFAMIDICDFLKKMAKENKILLPQEARKAFDELHRMGMPCADQKGFGYENFCKNYRT